MEHLYCKTMWCVIIVIGFFGSVTGQTENRTDHIRQLLDPVKEGQYLPEDAWLINAEGDTVTYQDFKGKWLLIDYWSTGCIPCIKEFPVLNEYYENKGDNQLEIITLSVDSKIQRWEKSRERYDLKMPKYYAGRDSSNPFFAINFQLMEDKEGNQQIVTLTPQYVLIDPKGKIVDKTFPKPSDPAFIQQLTAYLAAK